MLPILFLQPSDLATFDTTLNSAELLPPEASEPTAAFADILSLGVESAEVSELALGTPLPQAGNDLPQAAPSESDSDTATAVAVDGIPVPSPDSLRVELLPSIPVATAAADSALRGGLTPAAPPLLEPAPLPLTPAPVPGLRQSGLIPAELDAGQLSPVVPPPHSGKSPDRAALTPVPQPDPAPQTLIGQIARDLAAAPVVSAGAAPLVNEVVSGAQKASPAAALMTSGKMTELSTRSARSPEPLAPVTSLATGDQSSAEVRPLPVTTTATQIPQPQLQPVNTIEIPVGQQAQVGSMQLTPAQSAAAPDAAAPTTQLTQSIDVPVRDQAWGDRIGERVLLMASNRLQSAEIRLTPAELGPLRVQVAVDDGAANVTFLAQHAVTRDAIEQALPRLRELLAENGLTLNETNVGGNDEQGVHEGNSDNSDDPASLAQGTADPAADGDAADNSLAPRQPGRPDGLVDTFV